MNNRSRESILVGTALLATVSAAVWAWSALADARDSAAAAAADTAECRRLVNRIETARPAQRLATPSADLAGEIIASASKTALPPASIDRIDPHTIRREDGRSEQAAQVELRAVSLRQFLDFLNAVCTADDAVRLEHVRLSAPLDVPGGATWAAEFKIARPGPEVTSKSP
jgi:hypothetical protein